MWISLAITLVKDDLPYNQSGPQVPENDLHRHGSITKFQNVSSISGHQTCHLIRDILSKLFYMSKSHDDPENE